MNLLLLALLHCRVRILEFHFDCLEILDVEGRFSVIFCVIPTHYVVI